MPNDINELDVTDAGLKQIFGDRFADATVTVDDTPAENEAKVAQNPDTAKEPVDPRKPLPYWMGNFMKCAKSVLIFGGLNLLFFYWQQAGLMDYSVALPSMIVCAALAGFGVGKNLSRGSRD